MSQPTKEEFLKHVKNHKMKIINDSDVCRHILFRQPNDSDRYFQITTWPNHLCISGDMGTYVFSRIQDMFNFFKGDINPGYWGEKLQSGAGSNKDAIFEYSSDKAEQFIKDIVREKLPNIDEKIQNDIAERICGEVGVHEYNFESIIYDNLSDYEFDGDDHYDEDLEGIKLTIDFDDLCEARFKKVTYHYIWCLYAIVWGIEQYRKLKDLDQLTDYYANFYYGIL